MTGFVLQDNVGRHLNDALDAEDAAEKNFHVRHALQCLEADA